jgi:DNA-binding CsgD family transcriptional regulator
MLELQATATIDRGPIPIAIARRPPATSTAEAVLDRLAQALAVLDADGRLAYWNSAARERLGAAGWAVIDEHLRAPCASVRDALARAVRGCCTHGRMQLTTVSSPGQQRADAALVPIELANRRAAVLLLERPALCGSIELALFAASRGLTPAEQRVMLRLAQGQRPSQIAREFGVLTSTVRSQVASLRSKTQTASVAELLAGLARLPAMPAGLSART